MYVLKYKMWFKCDKILFIIIWVVFILLCKSIDFDLYGFNIFMNFRL